MDFVNETKMEAGWTLGFQPDGGELLIVAVKATFLIPYNGKEASLAEEQVPLTEADEFSGEPGFSAPVYETDYAHQKPFCDVLLNGSAYAPGEREVQKTRIAVKVGAMFKSFNVVGNRQWHKTILAVYAGKPYPFKVMPISYDNAFGGVDNSQSDPKKIKTFLANPVGKGFHYYRNDIDKKPMPNTEEIGKPIKVPNGNYKPMSLGPIGRNWEPRVDFTGTYDQEWLDHRAPFWPDDFNYRYFQAAPSDQQIPYPAGGEKVTLKNLTPQGITNFALPKVSMPILFIPYRNKEMQLNAVIDTIVIEPDKGRFMLTWRASLPLRQNCFEIKQVIAGKQLKSWIHTRRSINKPHYSSIAEFIKAMKQLKKR